MTAHPFLDDQPNGAEGHPGGVADEPAGTPSDYTHSDASPSMTPTPPATSPSATSPSATSPSATSLSATSPETAAYGGGESYPSPSYGPSHASPTYSSSVPQAPATTSASAAIWEAPGEPQTDTQAPTAPYGPYGAYSAYGPYGGQPQPTGYPTQTLPPMQPPMDPPVGAPPSQPKAPKRRRAGVVALVAAACLLGGAAGGAVGAQFGDDGTTPVVDTSTGTTGTTTQTGEQVATVSGTVQGAAATIMPSVVVIEVTGQSGGGTGSGVVMDTSGNIVTNAHVVEAVRNPDIKVTFSDGQTATATVVGVDVSSDLAVINVKGISNLTPATFADSDKLQIGQTVVAVGAPLGLSGTVTEGIVSAVQRPVRTGSADQGGQSTVIDAIQTDAAINPGNSGGPLVNLAGQVVGINSAIATLGGTSGESGSIGVGFSIPSDDVTNIADQLVKSGTAVHASLGVSVGEAKNGEGPVLEQVQPGSPAADAGLKAGDVITKVADRTVVDVDSLLAAIRDHQPGDQVTITLLRGGDEQTVTVTLGSKEG